MEQPILIQPNFNEVQDSVKEGEYKVRVMDSVIGQWPAKEGRPAITYINWVMETFDEALPKNNGRKIFYRTPIEGPGAFRLQSFYKAAMGHDCTGPFDRTALHGCELEVTMGLQKNDPTYTEVKAVRPVTH